MPMDKIQNNSCYLTSLVSMMIYFSRQVSAAFGATGSATAGNQGIAGTVLGNGALNINQTIINKNNTPSMKKTEKLISELVLSINKLLDNDRLKSEQSIKFLSELEKGILRIVTDSRGSNSSEVAKNAVKELAIAILQKNACQLNANAATSSHSVKCLYS